MNTHKTIFILLSFLMILGTVSARDSENIYALTEKSTKIMVDLIGKEPRGNGFDFFLQIGNNYHRITDCGDGQNLAQMLNTHLDWVGLTGETSLQAWDLEPRPSLSCNPTWLDTPVYLENFSTYYFSTGKAGEYYSINQNCGHPFYLTLFQLSNRIRKFQAPKAQKLIKLRCHKNSASVGDYALYFVEDARAGGTGGWVIVLSYRSKLQQPTWIVISKINGKYLKNVARKDIKSITKKLNAMNYGVKHLTYFPFQLPKDEPWFDICLDKCQQKTLAQLAKDKINLKGESYQKLTFSNLRFMACDSLLSQLVPDKPSPPKVDDQSDDWFSGMQAELKQSAATIFKCSTEICEREVPGGNYTVDEFQSNMAPCERKSHLHITLLGNVTIQGAKSIRIQSRTFKSFTIESQGNTLTYEKTGKGLGDSVAFLVAKNKQFGLKNLTLKIESAKNMPAVIKASKAKLKLDNVRVTGHADVALSLEHSTMYCFSCQLDAQKSGIVAKDSQIFAHGNGLISGKGNHAIYFSGKSDAILEGMTLEGKSLLFLGTKSRVLIDKAQLKPSSSVAFTLFSKRFPKEKGYALSIKNSQLVLESLQPTDFTMVKFHKRGDGSGNVEFVLDGVFDRSYLSCDGEGKLIFEGRDYCHISKNYRD